MCMIPRFQDRLAGGLVRYFLDLQEDDFESHVAILGVILAIALVVICSFCV